MSEQDERVLGELRRLAGELDPVPDEVTAYAKAALSWRRVDAELAELLSDSALEPESLAATRGLAQARWIVFRASALELDVALRQAVDGSVFLGQLAPPGPAAIEVQRDDGSVAAAGEADELGRFRLELATGGRIRLLVRREPPAPPVETSWLDA